MKIGIIDLDGVQIMALRDQEILPAIIVVVKEAVAPAGVGHADAANPGDLTGIREGAIAVVLIQGVALVGEIRDDDVRPAIIVEVREVAHAGEGSTISVNGDAGGEADFLKCAVALIVKEKFEHGIIGDEKVDMTVAIVIGDGDAQPFGRLV